MRKPSEATALFLDRDGVINVRKHGGYIQTPEEFRFLEGVPEAFAIFAKYFDKIVIVTNQQGIGKGLMSEEDKEKIEEAVKETLDWIDDHEEAEASEFEEKQKELEAIANPIMSQFYQNAQGSGAGSEGEADDDDEL